MNRRVRFLNGNRPRRLLHLLAEYGKNVPIGQWSAFSRTLLFQSHGDDDGMIAAIDPIEFVSSVRPLLERQDVPGLLGLLEHRWTCDQIANLLMTGDEDSRKVAALCLSLVGKRCTIDKIAEQ